MVTYAVLGTLVAAIFVMATKSSKSTASEAKSEANDDDDDF